MVVVEGGGGLGLMDRDGLNSICLVFVIGRSFPGFGFCGPLQELSGWDLDETPRRMNETNYGYCMLSELINPVHMRIYRQVACSRACVGVCAAYLGS